MLEHAPVTGTLLAISVLATALANRHYGGHALVAAQLIGTKLPLGDSNLGATTLAKRLSRLVPALWERVAIMLIPGGLCASLSLIDAVCGCAALSQLRHLERRWGPASTLSFSIICALGGAVVTEVSGAVSEALASSPGTAPNGVRILPAGLARVLSGSAIIVILSATLVRLLREIPPTRDGDVLRRVPLPAAVVSALSASPTRQQQQQPGESDLDARGTDLVITKSTVGMLMLVLKLVLMPETVFTLTPTSATASAAVASRREVHVLVDIGQVTRVLLFLTGAVLGLWSSFTHSSLNRFGVVPLGNTVCRPIVTLLRPIWHVAFGPSRVATHHVPPYLKARQEQAEAARRWQRRALQDGPGGGVGVDVDAGRTSVQNLAHGDVGGSGGGAVRPMGRDRAPRQAAEAGAPTSASATSRNAFGVDEAAVEQIRQLGLSVSDGEIRGALAAAHGDVNDAVQFLLASI